MEGVGVVHSERRKRDRCGGGGHCPLDQTHLQRKQALILRRVEIIRRFELLGGDRPSSVRLRSEKLTSSTHELHPLWPLYSRRRRDRCAESILFAAGGRRSQDGRFNRGCTMNAARRPAPIRFAALDFARRPLSSS